MYYCVAICSVTSTGLYYDTSGLHNVEYGNKVSCTQYRSNCPCITNNELHVQ